MTPSTTTFFPVFPGSSVVKNLPANAGDPGMIPDWRRAHGEGNDNPLQYSHLGNLMDKGAWKATVHGVAKRWTWLSNKNCPPSLKAPNNAVNKERRTLEGKGELSFFPGDFSPRWKVVGKITMKDQTVACPQRSLYSLVLVCWRWFIPCICGSSRGSAQEGKDPRLFEAWLTGPLCWPWGVNGPVESAT